MLSQKGSVYACHLCWLKYWIFKVQKHLYVGSFSQFTVPPWKTLDKREFHNYYIIMKFEWNAEKSETERKKTRGIL